MRKVMILASMLAMVMLAASPALAQTQSSEQNASGNNINQLSQQCQNVVGDITINNSNDAAISDDDTNAAIGGGGGDASSEQNGATGEDQYQYGDEAVDQEANNAGGDGGDATVSDDDINAIAQENNTTVNVVQNCIQQAEQQNVINVDAPAAPADDQYVAPGDDQYVAPEDDGGAVPGDDVNGDGVVDDADDVNGDGVVDDADAQAAAAGAAAPAGDDAEGGAVAVLPDTGGASLFTLGAGALLVAGGLLARRIIR